MKKFSLPKALLTSFLVALLLMGVNVFVSTSGFLINAQAQALLPKNTLINNPITINPRSSNNPVGYGASL
jgi:hypothetical protein